MFYHLEKSHSFFLAIILISFVGCSNREQSTRDIVVSAGQELSQKVDEISNTFIKYPKEGRLHLAAADSYRMVGGIPNEPRAHSGKEYEIAVQLEPKNRLARALWMKYAAERHTGAIARYYRNMEEPKKREESGGKVGAANIRKRGASRKPELDKKTHYFLEELNKSQDIDPDNALYNYLSAFIYFVGREREKAIDEIERGLKKKYVSLYTKERIEARQRLLDEIDFPSPERELFLTTSSSFGMRGLICKDLVEMGKEWQKNNKFNEAEKFYSMVVRIAEQTKEDNFFVGQEILSWDLSKYGLQHLKELYDLTKEDQKRNEVMDRLEKAESRMEYLYNLWKKAPSYDNIPQKQSYANEVVKKGQLEVLESLP